MALEVKLKDETVWLRQEQIAILFGTQRPAITKHLSNIFKSKELERNSVCSILEHTAADGKNYKTTFYNLDVIISVGYRINSSQATQFRIWATNVLKQHLIDGYTINEKRLKEQAENVKTLQRTVQMLADFSQRKALTSDETKGVGRNLMVAIFVKAQIVIPEYFSRGSRTLMNWIPAFAGMTY
jgi:hypothetical protein